MPVLVDKLQQPVLQEQELFKELKVVEIESQVALHKYVDPDSYIEVKPDLQLHVLSVELYIVDNELQVMLVIEKQVVLE